MFKKILLLLVLFVPFSVNAFSSDSFISKSITVNPGSIKTFYFTGTGGVYTLTNLVSNVPGYKFFITSAKSNTGSFVLIKVNPGLNTILYKGNDLSNILVLNKFRFRNISAVPIVINFSGYFFPSGSNLDFNGNIYSTSSGSTSLVEFSGNGISVNKDFYYTFFNLLLILFFVFLFSWKVILFVIKKL